MTHSPIRYLFDHPDGIAGCEIVLHLRKIITQSPWSRACLRTSKVISPASFSAPRSVSQPHVRRRTLASKNALRPQILTGANLAKPRFFKSPSHRDKHFLKYVDNASYSSLMFAFTTVCHQTSDCKRPLVMLTNREGSRYFFGKIPEGTQRVLNENGIRLGKLKSIFLTGTVSSWADIGGLPGLFLTISDATSRGIDVFTNSSKLLTYVVATWRYFVFRKGVQLNILGTEDQKLIGDNTATFRPVTIASSKALQVPDEAVSAKVYRQLKKVTSLMFPRSAQPQNDENAHQFDPSDTDIQTHVKLPSPSELIEVDAQPSLSYIIRFLPVRGKFDPVKAKALGVKPGLNYRKLTTGESVLNDNDELVHPHQVMEQSKSFQKVVILDIPSEDYLQNTINSEEWLSKSEKSGPEEVGLVYHFLGDTVDFQLPEYVKFIESFPPQCKHIVSHSSIADDTLVFKTYAVHLLKLKSILNGNFNLPHMDTHRPLGKAKNLSKLQALQTIKLDPDSIELEESDVVSETWTSLYNKNIGGKKERLTEILKKAVLPILPVEEPKSMKDHVQIVTLGTGSALPSIHRNVLSNLVRIPYVEDGMTKFNTVLLDGGENTLGALMRNYGHNNREQFKQIFAELRMIYLSHLHADHHLGIVSVMNAWFEANRDNDKKLYLVTPWQYNHFINEWCQLEEQLSADELNRIVHISCEEFTTYPEQKTEQIDSELFEKNYDTKSLKQVALQKVPFSTDHALIDQLYLDLRIRDIQTVRAIHCHWAYCVSITFDLSKEEQFKVSFSGDTRPNSKFVDIGQDSDLLIHEASLDNELIEEAIAKKHTTVVEAIKVCQMMNCPKLILTHFSARFSEKHSFITSAQEYNVLVNNLKSYLGSCHTNLSAQTRPTKLGFDDIEICYAYDMMTIRYNNVNCQKPVFNDIDGLTAVEETDAQKMKAQKEIQKRNEKREAKRIQRMGKRKRRLSNPEVE